MAVGAVAVLGAAAVIAVVARGGFATAGGAAASAGAATGRCVWRAWSCRTRAAMPISAPVPATSP